MLVAERGTGIGRKIVDLRFERALTQADLAKLSGVNEITISNIERGKQRPAARTLRKLASALDVDVRDLTVGPRDVPPDEPGLTDENRERIEEIRREREERAQRGDRENSNESGDRAP